MSGLIDRQALCEYALNQKDKSITPNEIMRFPSAEPVRHGKWREYPISDGMNQCSKCGVLRFGKSNYCPNCGCRMDEE